MNLSGKRILVLVSDSMVAHSILGVLEQKGAIVAVGQLRCQSLLRCQLVDDACSRRPVVKTMLDAGLLMIAYSDDAASFQKRFPGTPVIFKPAADAHFVSCERARPARINAALSAFKPTFARHVMTCLSQKLRLRRAWRIDSQAWGVVSCHMQGEPTQLTLRDLGV